MKTPFIVPPLLFSNFVQLPHFCVTTNPHSHCSFYCPVSLWLNAWSRHIWCAILLNNNMDLHMSSLGTLVPEGSWFAFYEKRIQVYWGLTHNVVFYWYSDLISQTQPHKHSQHTQGPADWHTHIINVYTTCCVHSSYLYYIKWLNE